MSRKGKMTAVKLQRERALADRRKEKQACGDDGDKQERAKVAAENPDLKRRKSTEIQRRKESPLDQTNGGVGGQNYRKVASPDSESGKGSQRRCKC